MNIMIPRGEIASFKEAMSKNFDNITSTLICLDAEKAQASNLYDRDQIFKVVREKIPCGFVTLNNKVKGHLREWYLEKCVEIAQEAQEWGLLHNIAVMLND